MDMSLQVITEWIARGTGLSLILLLRVPREISTMMHKGPVERNAPGLVVEQGGMVHTSRIAEHTRLQGISSDRVVGLKLIL